MSSTKKRGSSLLCSILNRRERLGTRPSSIAPAAKAVARTTFRLYHLYLFTKFYHKNALLKRRDFVISRLFQLIWLAKCLSTIMEEKFGDGRIKRQFFVKRLHWSRYCKTVHFVSMVQKWKVLLQRIQNYLFSHLNVQICDARIPTSGEMLITKVIKYFPEVKLTTCEKKSQSTGFFIAILRNFHARFH